MNGLSAQKRTRIFGFYFGLRRLEMKAVDSAAPVAGHDAIQQKRSRGRATIEFCR